MGYGSCNLRYLEIFDNCCQWSDTVFFLHLSCKNYKRNKEFEQEYYSEICNVDKHKHNKDISSN